MNEYILKAIEHVERNALEARARLVLERESPEPVAAGAGPALATLDGEVEEIDRIERLVSAARIDYVARYGTPPDAAAAGA